MLERIHSLRTACVTDLVAGGVLIGYHENTATTINDLYTEPVIFLFKKCETPIPELIQSAFFHFTFLNVDKILEVMQRNFCFINLIKCHCTKFMKS
jgi:hypothetical protein